MTEAIFLLLIGIAISIGNAVLLWATARKCQAAKPPSKWATEGVATAVSLAIVGLIVVGAAWTIKGTVLLMPDAISGATVGIVVFSAVILITMRLLDRKSRRAVDATSTRVAENAPPAVKRAA
ncbi:MAG: hypothetical protein R3D44_00640 [Hyphomicrobiaceae bacterium]